MNDHKTRANPAMHPSTVIAIAGYASERVALDVGFLKLAGVPDGRVEVYCVGTTGVTKLVEPKTFVPVKAVAKISYDDEGMLDTPFRGNSLTDPAPAAATAVAVAVETMTVLTVLKAVVLAVETPVWRRVVEGSLDVLLSGVVATRVLLRAADCWAT